MADAKNRLLKAKWGLRKCSGICSRPLRTLFDPVQPPYFPAVTASSQCFELDLDLVPVHLCRQGEGVAINRTAKQS